jgi:ubiquinone/menaquinone biosynthesis C-methylase UbiE
MPEQEEIYQSQAEGYDRLIQREDHEGNLLPALDAIVSLRGSAIIDIGAGTGRFPCMVSPMARLVVGLDRSMAMRVARCETGEPGLRRVAPERG